MIQGWLKTTRLLALVNKGLTNALVILITSRTPFQAYSDLTIERVLPIDQDFQCDIGNKERLIKSVEMLKLWYQNVYLNSGTDEEQKDVTDVFLNVTCRKSRTIFEMRPGVTTTNFVSTIFQAIEGKDLAVFISNFLSI